jgi:hypothetical protein
MTRTCCYGRRRAEGEWSIARTDPLQEIHAHEFVSGRGRVSDQIIGKHARSRIFRDLLALVAELPEVTVFNVCLEVRGRKDPQLDAWEEGKTRNLPIARIIEDPVFKASHQSFFIQLADCVSFALLKRETAPTPNIARYGIQNMFDECLASVCFKPASPRDPLGIVRK